MPFSLVDDRSACVIVELSTPGVVVEVRSVVVNVESKVLDVDFGKLVVEYFKVVVDEKSSVFEVVVLELFAVVALVFGVLSMVSVVVEGVVKSVELSFDVSLTMMFVEFVVKAGLFVAKGVEGGFEVPVVDVITVDDIFEGVGVVVFVGKIFEYFVVCIVESVVFLVELMRGVKVLDVVTDFVDDAVVTVDLFGVESSVVVEVVDVVGGVVVVGGGEVVVVIIVG